MSLPKAKEARLFYQSARQRHEDAEFLLEADRTTGAIYLAGYSVECMLKALILSATPASKREAMLASFRGGKAHDYEWLRKRYFDQGGSPFPSNVAKSFSLADTWTTDLRYQPGAAKRRDAETFLKAANVILTWADGRM